MPRNPFDYFGCPEFMVVVTRWDGKGTQPKEVFRAYASECTWPDAANSFAAQLRKSAEENRGRLAPKKGKANANARR